VRVATDPRLMDRTEAVELLEIEFPRLGLKHYRNLYDPSQTVADILTAVSRAKDEVVGPQAYLALAQAMRAAATDPAPSKPLRRLKRLQGLRALRGTQGHLRVRRLRRPGHAAGAPPRAR
jgi:hypothetical protein